MRYIWTSSLLFLACYATASRDGDKPQRGDASVGLASSATGDGGQGSVTSSGTGAGYGCGVERWAGPEGARRTFNCARHDQPGEPFQCNCDGEQSEVASDECASALASACDVDPEIETDFCEGEPLGTCWPGATGDGFRCRCSGAPDLVERSETDCTEALFRSCGTACEDATGRCTPVLDGLGFECQCALRDLSWPGEFDCAQALSGACHPACEHAGGQCYLSGDNQGLACRCGEATDLVLLTYEALGHDDCEGALVDLCGPDPNPEEDCEKQGAHGSGRCRLPHEGGFTCSCTTPGGAGTQGGSEVAPSCLEQLMLVCPQAFE